MPCCAGCLARARRVFGGRYQPRSYTPNAPDLKEVPPAAVARRGRTRGLCLACYRALPRSQRRQWTADSYQPMPHAAVAKRLLRVLRDAAKGAAR